MLTLPQSVTIVLWLYKTVQAVDSALRTFYTVHSRIRSLRTVKASYFSTLSLFAHTYRPETISYLLYTCLSSAWANEPLAVFHESSSCHDLWKNILYHMLDIEPGWPHQPTDIDSKSSNLITTKTNHTDLISYHWSLLPKSKGRHQESEKVHLSRTVLPQDFDFQALPVTDNQGLVAFRLCFFVSPETRSSAYSWCRSDMVLRRLCAFVSGWGFRLREACAKTGVLSRSDDAKDAG